MNSGDGMVMYIRGRANKHIREHLRVDGVRVTENLPQKWNPLKEEGVDQCGCAGGKHWFNWDSDSVLQE